MFKSKNNQGKKKFYRPSINKKNFNTIGRYSKFIRQFIDVDVWGIEKRHRCKQVAIDNLTVNRTTHQLKTKQKYELTFKKGEYFGYGKNKRLIQTLDDIFLIDRDEHPYYADQWNKDGWLTFERNRKHCIETHLIACQENDSSNLIYYTNDPSKEYNLICLDFDDVQDYESIIDFMSFLFPDCYCEISSSGKGLHYYIMVQFNVDRFWCNEQEGAYRNRLYELLTNALSGQVDYFDAVKATCSQYNLNNILTKCGTLCCLPSPVNYEKFHQLYNCSVFNELYLYQVINYLNDLTCQYNDCIPYPLEISTEDMKCPPILIKEREDNKPSIERGLETETNNSFVREMSYISGYVIEYYKTNQSIPSKESVYQEYINENNYPKQDEDRRNRFYKSYDYFMQSFNPELIKGNSYQYGMYLDKIEWTDEQLTEWVNMNTSYKRKIYRNDVDVAMGYIFICGKNNMNVSRIKAIRRLMKQEGISHEQAVENLKDTAGVDGMMEFFKLIRKQNPDAKINRCGKKKAIALFKLLEHIELIECVDGNHYTGICRKYRLR